MHLMMNSRKSQLATQLNTILEIFKHKSCSKVGPCDITQEYRFNLKFECKVYNVKMFKYVKFEDNDVDVKFKFYRFFNRFWNQNNNTKNK